MKKITKAILFYFSLLGISVVLQSCCTNTYKIIDSGTITAYTVDYTTTLDTITGGFLLVNQLGVEYSMLEDLNLISSALATTCAEEYKNTLLTEAIKITCDKDFLYDGNTISSGTDLSDLAGLDLNYLEFRGPASMEYHFQESFFGKAELEKEWYTFTLMYQTDDGLELENEITLFFDL